MYELPLFGADLGAYGEPASGNPVPRGDFRSQSGTASNGTKATISGNTLRSKLSLPGAWIRTPVSRLSGDDRYATSVAIGRAAYPQATTVIVTSARTRTNGRILPPGG